MKLLNLMEALELNKRAASDPKAQARQINVISHYGMHQFRLFAQAYLTEFGQGYNLREEMYGGLEARLLEGAQGGQFAAHFLLLDSDSLGIGSSLRRPEVRGSNGQLVDANRVQEVLGMVTDFALSQTSPVVIVPLLVASPLFSEFPETTVTDVDRFWHAAMTRLSEGVAGLKHVSLLKPIQPEIDDIRFVQTGEPMVSKSASQVAQYAAQALVAISTGYVPGNPLKKLLITDLDGTFWHGIVGDDGWQALQCDDSPKGQPHWLYQRLLKRLSHEGVVLAVSSKNTAAVVDEAFAKMTLTCPRDRISLVVANWGAKSESIRNICDTLNLLPESAVFVDDNELELAEVGAAIPGLTCVAFPKAISGVPAFLKQLRSHFVRGLPATGIEERLQSYRTLAELNTFVSEVGGQQSSEKYQTYLKSLEMNLEVFFAESKHADRVFELINKTNQFNLNGKRFDKVEFSKYMGSRGCIGITLKDRYNDFGIIGAALVEHSGNDLVVDQCVLSCRVFSRQIEQAMFHAFPKLVRGTKRDVQSLKVRLKRTDRNQPVFDFLKPYVDDLGSIGKDREVVIQPSLGAPDSFTFVGSIKIA